jgi:hypothetical protein
MSVFVLVARRMEPEHSGSSSQRPLGLSSRVAFCYPGSLLISSKGRLSALGCRKSTCHVLTVRRARPPLSSKFATQTVSEPQQPRPFASCWWNLGTTYRRQALFVCEGLPASPPIPRQGTLVTSRMEVRSALGPAITRAGGIKSNEGRRPIMKIPSASWCGQTRSLKQSNLERLSRPTFATVLLSLPEIGAGNRGSAAWLSSPFALKL